MDTRGVRTLVLALILLWPSVADAQTRASTSLARARGLIVTINGGDEVLRQFVTTTFDPSFLEFAPVDRHLKV